MDERDLRWLDWAKELQFLAQSGLAYCRDPFDIERFGRIRAISAEIMSEYSGIPTERVMDLFCGEEGYQTPKLDTRAAIFSGDTILLVREQSGAWALPGGWVDAMESVRSNTIKEVREEAGLEVEPSRLIALQDRRQHNQPPYAYNICKVFVLCRVIRGSFVPNTETTESRYFGLDELPELATEKVTKEQIALCFRAKDDEHWQPTFD